MRREKLAWQQSHPKVHSCKEKNMAAGLTQSLCSMFLCVKAPVLTLSKGSTSLDIPNIKMHMSFYLLCLCQNLPLSCCALYNLRSMS